MKKILTSLFMLASVNSFALVGDSGQVATVYITNSSGEDVTITSENPFNDSGFSRFKCLYQYPKQYADLPSPTFKTMMISGELQQSTQFAVIPKGRSVVFALDSSCDSTDNIDAFGIRSLQNYDRVYAIGSLNQDISNRLIRYGSRVHIHAMIADVHGSGAIAPLQITLLPLKK